MLLGCVTSSRDDEGIDREPFSAHERVSIERILCNEHTIGNEEPALLEEECRT